MSLCLFAAAGAAEAPICFECFWEHQPVGFREELRRYYEQREPGDPLVAADVRYLVARVDGDAEGICEAFERFERLRQGQDDPRRRLFADEFLAFTAADCERTPRRYFRQAARSAARAGEAWKGDVYDEVARGRFRPEFADAGIARRIEVPQDVTSYVLGQSAIRVRRTDRIGVQVERTVRDWISYQMQHDFSGGSPARDRLLDYHEGARLRDLLQAVNATVVPLSGTLIARDEDGRWLAPDEAGAFRFEVLPDKLQYPTTRVHGDLALVVDTHGLSSLVEPAARRDVDVVIGCGDYTAKAQAAHHLARLGIDVYFPCDRFVGDLIGYDAPGVLIGSAPVRIDEDEAVIGDRPVVFRVAEQVVVQDTKQRGVLQYYDAPARYFRRLATLLPLDLVIVEIDGAGQADRVVERARASGAAAIAIRIWTDDDHRAVRGWLAESRGNRAILFHSAAYPAGILLFDEFPEQTTFGDPRPRFVAGW